MFLIFGIVRKKMSKYRCPKGCRFHTNNRLLMIKHSIVEHNASYSKEFVINLHANNRKLKAEVLTLIQNG